jgi:hypothetical protein
LVTTNATWWRAIGPASWRRAWLSRFAIYLSVLDEHFAARWAALGPEWKRVKHRRAGGAVMKLVRYADDCAPRTLREVAM